MADDFKITVPRFIAPQVELQLRLAVKESMRLAGSQPSPKAGEYWWSEATALESMRADVESYLRSVGDWVDD